MQKLFYLFTLVACFSLFGCASSTTQQKAQDTQDLHTEDTIPAEGAEVQDQLISIDFNQTNPCEGIQVCKMIICAEQPDDQECNFMSEAKRQITRVVVYESMGCTYTERVTGEEGRGVGTGTCPAQAE